MTNLPDFTSHEYEVIRELGANRGAGRVAYLARQIDSGQSVVIKEFQFGKPGANWDGQKAIDREIKILQQLKHPNIPRYLSSFETDHTSCIVQEYIDGKPLSAIISNQQQLYTPEQVKEIILKLLEVLVYLQTEFTDPVLHRDLKPANILIDSNNEPYLIDFGGAKVSEGEGGSTVAIGTLGFMPPEQRFQQFNKTTDIYSLGLTIVCWLTRTEPMEMYNIINIGNNRVIGLRESLLSYSLRFVDWLEKIVEPDPKDRYPDAETALAAFKPLYVKRVPEAIVSTRTLEFTATKLGERMTQTVNVRNDVSETVLEGWWEVAPHPSDPPHTPHDHEWISFSPRKFEGNNNECSIVVKTDKLMADKIYKRQILLHSNSSEETEELDLIIRTAKVPIQAVNLPYQNLLFLLLLIIGIILILKIYLVGFASLLVMSIVVILCILGIISFFSMFTEAGGAGCLGLIILGMAGSAITPLANYHHNRWSFDAIIAFFIMIGMLYMAFKLIKDVFHEPNPESDPLLWKSMFSVIFSGTLVPFVFSINSSVLMILGFIVVLTPTVSILSYPTIKQKKLVSKYRDSEEGLIKP
jgi:serine/threonine protein kinase